MRALFVVTVVSLAVAGCGGAPADPEPVEYVGQLQQELISSAGGAGGVLEEASEEAVASLGDLVPEGAGVQVSEIDWMKDTKIPVYLIAPGEGDRFVVADGDGSGGFEESEKSILVATREGGTRYEATVTLTLDDGPVPTYDMVVAWTDYSGLELDDPEDMPEPRLRANKPVVEGTVDVNGHEVMVKVPYSFELGGVAPGHQNVDADHDGAYDGSFTSRESTYVREGSPQPIYRIDDRYVSIKGIDLENWTITFADHPAEDYKRVELAIGNELPDFEFIDFDGNQRRLSEFRGKYLLVDVWGTWCGPCRADVPHHKAAYAAYKDKGFEILGLADEQSKDGEFDEGLEKAKAYVAEQEMTWTQATEESVKDFLVEGLMVRAWPTAILLDPEGKIISLDQRDQPRLRFEKLEPTLEELLGSHSPQDS